MTKRLGSESERRGVGIDDQVRDEDCVDPSATMTAKAPTAQTGRLCSDEHAGDGARREH
jgi:hypothetical protein